MFVLCRTSNGGAKDFEYEKLADGRHVYDLVGDKLNALGKDLSLIHILGMGAIGVWIAMVVDWVCRVTCFVTRFRRGVWKEKYKA